MTKQQPLRTLLEAFAVGAVGLALALGANWVSPRGLSLTRNYFPTTGGTPATNAVPDHSGGNGSSSVTNGVSSNAVLVARLEVKGLHALDGLAAEALFRDPGYAQERILFVDARNDQHYLEGHIPGAYQLDHYYPANYLPVVLPACLQAEIVVVYCNGGDCEDSEFAALTLKEAGVPADRLRVYVGGIEDWAAAGRPVETGARGSGLLRGTTP